MTDTPGRRILVPIEESASLRDTVAHVVSTAVAEAAPDAPATIHFVYAEMWRQGDPHFDDRELDHLEFLEQVGVWAESDLTEATEGDDAPDPELVTIETATLSGDRYLFSPTDYADTLAAYAETHGLERIVLDPGYDPVGNSALLSPLATELERRGFDAQQAPVDRPARRRAFPQPRGSLQFLAIFGVSYVFYLLRSWFGGVFDVVTGLIGAAIVGVALSRISLTKPLPPVQTAKQLLRFGLYTPYLLWEVTKANLSIARVILDPRLPIDPSVVRFRAAVWGGLPVTTLANSITLTPGTLTIDVGNREFLVHSLTTESRSDLLEGSLERAVRFVFWGRAAARIPSPRERGETGEGAERE
jgi:multicomponent Na+:H+ antiporter subunit E